MTFTAPLLLFILPEALSSKIGRVSLIAAGAVSLTLQAMFVITGTVWLLSIGSGNGSSIR